MLSWLKSLFSSPRPKFIRFRDNLGNFEIFYPSGWKYDEDIAIVDGKYTIAFESGSRKFSISVDAKLPEKFNFLKYMKEEFESPSSGIYAPGKRARFRKYPAFSREFSYSSGGKAYFGYGLMFRAGSEVFNIYWTGPEPEREALEKTFSHMLESLVLKEGFRIEKKKAGEGTFEFSPPLKENARG